MTNKLSDFRSPGLYMEISIRKQPIIIPSHQIKNPRAIGLPSKKSLKSIIAERPIISVPIVCIGGQFDMGYRYDLLPPVHTLNINDEEYIAIIHRVIQTPIILCTGHPYYPIDTLQMINEIDLDAPIWIKL